MPIQGLFENTTASPIRRCRKPKGAIDDADVAFLRESRSVPTVHPRTSKPKCVGPPGKCARKIGTNSKPLCPADDQDHVGVTRRSFLASYRGKSLDNASLESEPEGLEWSPD